MSLLFISPHCAVTRWNVISSLRARRLSTERLEARRLLAADEAAEPVPALMAEGHEEGEQVAEFSLLDVNPNSARYNQAVSPRNYLGQVSAWYFTRGT